MPVSVKLGVAALGAALGVACAPAPAGRTTDGTLTEVAINSGQGVQYVQAAAVAAIVEKYTPMMAFAEPTRSHVAAMPLFQSGDLDFIFVSQSEMALANRGAEYYSEVGPTPMRVVAAGAEVMFAFYTDPEAGIERIEDLAGKRVMWETEAAGVFYWAARYLLEYYDLIDAVVSIPSPQAADRAEALKAGRIDAFSSSTQYEAMEILHSSIGLRMLDIPPDAAEYVHSRYPALYAAICPAGYNGGMVTRDVPVLAASTGLHARADLDDATVRAVLEAIYDHFDEFAAAHPTLLDMRLDRAVSLDSVVPYHPAAVRFFQERGVWTPEAEAMQAALLDQVGA